MHRGYAISLIRMRQASAGGYFGGAVFYNLAAQYLR